MNKRLLFILPLFLLSISGFAQLQKGNKLLGGTINYSTSKNTSDNSGAAGGSSFKFTQFNNSPILGYFVSDRTVLGLRFDFNTSSSENTPISGSTSRSEFNQFGFGPFVRRYFPIKEWVAIYGQAGVEYSSGKSTSTSDFSFDTTTKRFGVVTTLGLALFPTNWMSLDLAINPLSYYHVKTKNENGSASNESSTNNFNFNLSTQSIGIGAHFFFNKK